VAPNGGGKTAILDAIAVALGPFVGKTGKTYGRKFHVHDSRRVVVPLGRDAGTTPSPFQEIKLEATGELGGQAVTWKRQKLTERGGTTVKEASSLTSYATWLIDQLKDPERASSTVLPIVAYYGTGRLLGARAAGIGFQQPRNFGYKECLSAGSKFDSFTRWFKEACLTQLLGRTQGRTDAQQRNLEDAVRNVKDAVQKALEPYGKCWIDYDAIERNLFICDIKHGTNLGLDRQSDGVQAVVCMVGDIASRTSLLNPQFGSEAAQRTSGIVLIDEVDMHLHPSWQQRVLQSLTGAFPRIQFIVTTHSPQVLSTVNPENIRIIGPDATGQIIAAPPLAMTYGEPSGDVLQSVMMVDPQPPIAEKGILLRLTELVDQGEYASDEAEGLMHALRSSLGATHPQLLRLSRSIERQKALRR